MILFAFLLIMVRVATVAFIAPILGSRTVPAYIRFFLSFAVALCVFPILMEKYDPTELVAGDLTSSLFAEVITGGLIGLGILVIFSAAMMIGTAIGQLSGIQLDGMVSGLQAEFGQQPVTVLIGIISTATFVLVGGPELIVTTVLDSFMALPPGRSLASGDALGMLTSVLQQSFELTVRAIAPAVATLLTATIVVGFMSRILPQLNLIQVGISSNMAIMMLALVLTLGGSVWLVIDHVEETSREMVKSMKVVENTQGQPEISPVIIRGSDHE